MVKVKLVAEWLEIVLAFSLNDEISKLGEAVLQRIQWPRIDIVVRSKQVSSQTVAKAITKSASDASKLPTKESESAGAPKSAPITAAAKSAQITAAAKSVTNTAAAPNDAPNAPITAAPKSVEKVAASADKIGAANSGTQKGSKKQEPIRRSKEAAGKKQPKKKGAASSWTQENSKYRYGRPLLTAAELENAGPATTSLHNYYLQCCAKKKKYSGLIQVWPSSARS